MSLALKEVGNCSGAGRFQFVTKEAEEDLQKGFTPENTQRSTQWALNVFRDWKTARVDAQEEACPDDLLERANPADLVRWLALFAAEARNGKGENYTPTSISNLLAGILRYMRSLDPSAPNFLDKKDPRFKLLHNSLDSLYHKLRTMNVGTVVKHAEVFSKDEEVQLWETGTLGIHSPQALLNAVFFLNGKNFCLRGGDEHRSLKLSQLKRGDDPPSYLYVENGSKNRSGTFSQRYVPNKTVPIYANPLDNERCHVQVLDLYISKLPKDAIAKDIFYVRPLARIPADRRLPWFTAIPIGKNELARMVPKMCEEGGIAGRKTNHSLRATGATQMFQANVPEKIIQERTGHRSTDALRLYERTTEEQHKAVTKVLGSNMEVSYTSVLQQKKAVQDQVFPMPQLALPMPQPVLPTTSPVMNMTGCTVNISFNQAPPPRPLLPEISPGELDQLFMDFP